MSVIVCIGSLSGDSGIDIYADNDCTTLFRYSSIDHWARECKGSIRDLHERINVLK